MKHRSINLAVAAAIMAAGFDAYAGSTCNDAKVFSAKLVTDVCWSCLFPIKVAGMKLGSGRIPETASDKAACFCGDGLGEIIPGAVTSGWQFAYLAEVVREPGCSPILGGISLPVPNKAARGSHGDGTLGGGDLSAYHYHIFSFPLAAMLEIAFFGKCDRTPYQGIDLMYMSELDPSWLREDLALLAAPETAILSSPGIQAACAADAVSAGKGKPLDGLFWCAGHAGMYPVTGITYASGSIPENTSEILAKALFKHHRLGLMPLTSGDDYLCESGYGSLKKGDYEISMFSPISEASGSHAIGENTFFWGEHRSVPGSGEDPVYVIYRYTDCCRTIDE